MPYGVEECTVACMPMEIQKTNLTFWFFSFTTLNGQYNIHRVGRPILDHAMLLTVYENGRTL